MGEIKDMILSLLTVLLCVALVAPPVIAAFWLADAWL